MTNERVGRTAYLLGYAGLLPQLAALLWTRVSLADGWLAASGYALLVLSFLGGTWWGFAMRAGIRQPIVTMLALIPLLLAIALTIATVRLSDSAWPLIATGVAIMLTVPVDRWLELNGITPPGWTRLRLPLSAGLGLLTIAAGALAGA